MTALVIYLLSCWRAYKFRKMLCKSQQGYLLITDRYPQVEVPGFRFDGPQLAKPRAVTVDKNVKAARAEAVPMDGILFARIVDSSWH